jgi:hypothetical protein
MQLLPAQALSVTRMPAATAAGSVATASTVLDLPGSRAGKPVPVAASRRGFRPGATIATVTRDGFDGAPPVFVTTTFTYALPPAAATGNARAFSTTTFGFAPAPAAGAAAPSAVVAAARRASPAILLRIRHTLAGSVRVGARVPAVPS